MTDMNTGESLKVDFRRLRSPIPVGELGEGDGIDPKYETRKRDFQQGRDKPDHAARRLARQMRQALATGESWSALPELESFVIADIYQSGASNTYTVRLCCTDPEQRYAPDEIVRLLRPHKGLLRRDIASAINRKRVPELLFEVLPPGVQA